MLLISALLGFVSHVRAKTGNTSHLLPTTQLLSIALGDILLMFRFMSLSHSNIVGISELLRHKCTKKKNVFFKIASCWYFLFIML